MASRLAAVHRREVARLRAAAALAAQLAFDDLPSIDQRHMADFLEQVVPVVGAAQSNAVALTDAYMADYLSALDLPREARGLDPAKYGRGVPPETVYARPFVHTWTKQRDGMEPVEARRFGRFMAGQLANTDVQIAARGASSEWMRSEPRIVGYRRVIGPGACKFCTLVSTQRYHTGDLLPIHPSCGCGTEPIVGTHDPGQVIDPDRLAELKGVEVKTVNHGELGPTLYDAAHVFDTAA